MRVEKVAVVTGAAGGIGAALCRRLTQAGAAVVATDVDSAGLRVLARSLDGASVYTQRIDSSDGESLRRLLTGTVADLGRIDYLFNNARVNVSGPFEQLTPEQWRRLVDVNIWGVVQGTRHAYPLMRAQGFGHIVNTASIAGMAPVPRSAAYAMTMHAIVGLSTSLRAEAAGAGVRVSVAVPGPITSRAFDTGRAGEYDRPPPTTIGGVNPDLAACQIIRGMRKNKQYIVFPRYNRALVTAYRLFPNLMAGLTAAPAPGLR
ncbi:SDR family NAD(P)-dependent oxidoreductase [Nocardia donostiensis]|uniref:Ketoreductase domain-containing protein n=1 Tax=Nocardia donostiensis TaxID=1538463 RepID=A0A1W0BM13_9NOCA|nr:SDR family NAD(P)-dependent oxidoreductase [Nocardia donostiensis]ONM50113.1 hypothetical protein B0T46_03210 [Nocardia donostiensis]OQS15775.1 hypothetical protein B0T36_07305 [Nocardia donostiensis]OQS23580.1 hypothetical protein B0T44_01745 [Nocardia donostiensis]